MQQGPGEAGNPEGLDAVQLLLTAGRRVVGDLSRSSLVAGLGAVDAIPSANTWSASITAEHRWAVSGYRLNRYDEACGCFSCTRKQLHPV